MSRVLLFAEVMMILIEDNGGMAADAIAETTVDANEGTILRQAI